MCRSLTRLPPNLCSGGLRSQGTRLGPWTCRALRNAQSEHESCLPAWSFSEFGNRRSKVSSLQAFISVSPLDGLIEGLRSKSFGGRRQMRPLPRAYSANASSGQATQILGTATFRKRCGEATALGG